MTEPATRSEGADLLIAAVAAAAEASRLVVLHYDHDFDLIVEITGQPTDWILPTGAVS